MANSDLTRCDVVKQTDGASVWQSLLVAKTKSGEVNGYLKDISLIRG